MTIARKLSVVDKYNQEQREEWNLGKWQFGLSLSFQIDLIRINFFNRLLYVAFLYSEKQSMADKSQISLVGKAQKQ